MSRGTLRRLASGTAAVLGLLGAASARAQVADFTFNMEEVGNVVVLYGSGTVPDPTGLSQSSFDVSLGSAIKPNAGYIVASGNTTVTEYAGVDITGPANFGLGGKAGGLLHDGQAFGFDLSGSLYVPQGFKGGPLADTMVIANASFASLGVTRGDYLWTVRSSVPDSSDQITIALDAASRFEPAPVPEPASALLLGAGLIGLAALRRRVAN